MRAKAAALILPFVLACLAAVEARAQEHATPKYPPQLKEAERLNAEVVGLYNAGRFEEALPFAARALALREKAHGPDSPELLGTLFQLGRHTNSLRGSEESERYFRRFAEFGEKTKAAPAEDVALAYLRIGCSPERRGRREEADVARRRTGSVIEDGGLINARVISKPQPDYPLSAKMARARGTVEVEAVVSEAGEVVSARARGNADSSLKGASESAAYKARFTPAAVDGKPVKVRGVITYKFVIR